ncbi:MMPL family transporter [Jatrophihabitans telluris]|uniref:MMPL family transporter n=1 Tax=Jatrophihabitans telluris TaxID=2038343 RepID=A0ABY4QWN9_9ACTN|nr:MMPL family transporter [Jatrophihabitans telluris]UQX87456.1 MMPL family transporter [Jatrophihabitans telluris]
MSTTRAAFTYPEAAAGAAPGGRMSRLGIWSATHLRVVLVGWLVIVGAFGAFAPQVESVLSGGGWQDSGSQSIAARDVIAKDFAGLGSTALQVVVHDSTRTIFSDPDAQRVIARITAALKDDRRISTVVPPQPGLSVSRDGRTAVVQAGAAADANAMVRAADELNGPLRKLSTGSVTVQLTGSSALWANFNKVNHAAMIRSEVLSWPVTMVVLVLAFGSLVAAGLPLMLTLAGLVTAAGALVLATHVAPVSIWAMNFAMMFALALGIDYALFIVVRFRAALRGRADEPDVAARSLAAVAETMDTAGKAVAFSSVTVLVSLSTVLLVPSPAFRGVTLGIMLAVVAVLAATLTLLPAVLGRLGTRIDAGTIRFARSKKHDRSPSGLSRVLDRWGALLHRRPWLAGGLAVALLSFLAWPVTALHTGMPSISIIPASQSARAGYVQIADAFGPGAPGTLSVLTRRPDTPIALTTLGEDRGIAAVMPAGISQGWSLTLATPTTDASAKATGASIERLRRELPTGSLVGGAAAENHDLERVIAARTPLVFGLLIGLGFLLLLVALGSPLVAFAGVVTNLASIAAAFGVATWIFQDGHLSGALAFEPQGFVDAWGPLFFGAMLSGVAMDYTLFLLSSAREHYDRTGNPDYAMRMALQTSGRVVLAAAAVMVAVFLTFALAGPLAPKEMGIILAVAVFLDALLVRLLVLPVVLRIAGHAAWHLPAWLGRVLPSVTFSH